MSVRTYDPKEVILLMDGIPISGYADGTFVMVERTSDAFTKVSGSDGDVSRVKTNDKSGTITVTLAQTSPGNDILTGLALLDEQSNSGVVPVAVVDKSGRSTYASGFGWVRKMPNSEFSKDVSNREWIIDCANMQWFVGGNAQAE